jgi:DnaK suppressor protein
MLNAPTLTTGQMQDLKAILENRQSLLKNQEHLDLSNIIKTVHDGLDPKHEEFSESNSTVSAEQQLIKRHAAELQGIAYALTRMRQGKFGRCVECESVIDFPRLLAYPTAIRCMGCQEEFERVEKRGS